jgi:hypothetical protein
VSTRPVFRVVWGTEVVRAAKIPAAAIALLGAVASAPIIGAPISTPTANAAPRACPVGGDLAPAPPRADPRGFFSREKTLITVTSEVPYTPFLGLIKSSVTLLRVDESGNPVATLGTMYDDGTHGDAQPGDGQYTRQFTFNEAAAGPIFLAVRAMYQSTRAASQGSPASCRQSYNNDRQIVASGPRPSAAQLKAEYAVFNAADAYYVSDVAQVGPVQARQDVIEFLLSSYGPDGTVNRGLVVSAVPGPDGESVWWTYNDGLDAGLVQAMPGVKGSGSPKKQSRDGDKPRTTTTCRIGETRAPMRPLGTPQEFRAGLSTKIDATLQVTLYPNLIPDSVTLLQVDSHGNRMAVLGKMRGDGRHHDVPVDYTRYTAQPTLGRSVAAGEIFLAAEASYSGTPEGSQLDNNDHEIDAGTPIPTTAQWRAQDRVSSAAWHYYESCADQVGPVQAKQDLVNFLLNNYGPEGTIQRGLVVSAVVTRDGQSVWWTYNDGLDEGLGDNVPGVMGSGTPRTSESFRE